jgi:peroxiredoxin
MIAGSFDNYLSCRFVIIVPKMSRIISMIFAGLLFFPSQSRAKTRERMLLHSLESVILPSADGKSDTLASVEHHKATVFVFVSSECPISNSYMPLLSKLCIEFAEKDIAFFGVIADPGETSQEAKKFASDYQFPRDMLMDAKQDLTLLLSAHITPEVIVVSRSGKIEYDGRIDDRFVALGKSRVKALHHDLHDALENIAEGKKVTNPKTKVIGCAIPIIEK